MGQCIQGSIKRVSKSGVVDTYWSKNTEDLKFSGWSLIGILGKSFFLSSRLSKIKFRSCWNKYMEVCFGLGEMSRSTWLYTVYIQIMGSNSSKTFAKIWLFIIFEVLQCLTLWSILLDMHVLIKLLYVLQRTSKVQNQNQGSFSKLKSGRLFARKWSIWKIKRTICKRNDYRYNSNFQQILAWGLAWVTSSLHVNSNAFYASS